MENQQYRTQPQTSREGSAPLTSQQAAYAAERAQLMFGCYRRGDANDPEIYAMAIAAVLAEYPAEVIKAVTDPRKGLPRKLKWLPSVAELAEACDEEGRYQAAKRYVEAHPRIEKRVDEIKRTAESDAEMAKRFADLLKTLRAPKPSGD